jgi:hypothetical protein
MPALARFEVYLRTFSRVYGTMMTHAFVEFINTLVFNIRKHTFLWRPPSSEMPEKISILRLAQCKQSRARERDANAPAIN